MEYENIENSMLSGTILPKYKEILLFCLVIMDWSFYFILHGIAKW